MIMTSPCPPPVLRKLVLISTAAAMLFGVFVAGDAQLSRAQSTPSVDYDIDDDGLIEVDSSAKWLAISHDLDGNGIVANTATAWTTAFPNAMTAAGCPARDHDGDAMTADQASCLGYELIRDINLASISSPIIENADNRYEAKIVGNGFRLLNPNFGGRNSAAAVEYLGYSGSIEGLGAINPRATNANTAHKGAFVSRLEGELIGVYVEGGDFQGSNQGAFGGRAATNAADGGSVVAHSYANNVNVGSFGETTIGGLVAVLEHQRGSNISVCLNSYFSGVNRSNDSRTGIVTGQRQNHADGNGRIFNCVGDTTADSDSIAGDGGDDGGIRATNAQMTAVVDYNNPATNNPFSSWDDYPLDGSWTALASSAPRTDAWYFGDETNLPVLKLWGHDWTRALDRSKSGTDTVNLCTRNLAVANEIIRHLQDDVRRSGVTTTPAAVTALTPCTASTDTRDVSITNLTDLVVTSPDHTFNVRPDRTFPPAEKIATLDRDDFEYLTNAAHFDLGGNDLETLPPRIFQGIPLRYLDLSNNKLTSLHPDVFAGVATVSDIGGNTLLLNGNSLTDTGLPGRIFDTLTHLNGLDLSDNALTRVNTRWFEKLVNLGRKASTNPPYTHALGLHLSGNTITEHYYTFKRFTGVTESSASYAGSTAGDTLRTAITTAITTAAGGTTPTTLSLTGTDYWYNSGGATTGYQSGGTTCLSTQTFGPGRGDYLGGTAPACQVQPHWTPPHTSTDTAAGAPGLSTSGTRGSISVEFSHFASSNSNLIAYQMRWRPSTVDPWTSWQTAPITPAAGAKTFTMPAPDSGLDHLVQLRVLRTTRPPSAPIDGTATTSQANWVAGFDATTSTTALGAIDLSWTAFDAAQLPSNHTIIAFYYRLKLQSDPVYGAWRQVPDGSDTGTSLTDETGYTLTGLKRDGTYDIQLVGGIDGTDADSDLDYFTNRSTDTATALEVPASLRAVPGTAPGTIAVTWNQQVVATTAQTRFRVRWKLKSTAAWTGVTWTAVADSDSDGQTHDETAYTITGLLASTEEYDIEVGFFWNSTIGWQDAIPTSAFAAAIPAPTGLTAAPSTTLGQINVSWDQQRYSTASNAKLQVRVQWSTGGTWIAWQDVADGPDPGSHAYDEITRTVTGLEVGRPHDVQVRLMVGTTGGTVAQVDDINAGFHPQGMRATTGDTPGTIDVTWTQQTAYAEAWRRFHISPRLSSASAWQSWINIADETASSHQLTGLTAGELYDVRMMFNRNSEHDWPDQNFLPMLTGIRAGFVQAPTNLRVVPSTTAAGALDLSWDQQTASTDGMSKFQYRTRLSSATDWTGVTWQDIGDGGDDGSHAYDESSATISGLQQGVSYDIELRFHWNSTHGESEAASAMAVSASVPSPPSFRAEAGATSGAAVLTWDAMQGIDSLQYRYRATGAASYGSWTNVTDSNSNSNTGDETAQTITGLTPGTDYDFQVQALVSATPSTPASDSAKAQRHSVPTNFAVAVGSNPGELDLTWGTPAAGTTVAGFQYRHKRSDQPESAYTTWAAVPDSGSNGRADERAYTITSLWAGVSHDVQISTEAGTTRSVPNSATTATATPTPVAAPTALTGARGAAPGAIDLTWTAPASATLPTGDSIAHYQYRAKPASSATWGEWTDIPSANAASYTATVPNAYTLYDIELRAAVADGTEGTATTAEYYSTAASATGIRSGIASPAGFTAVAGTNPGDLNLTWTAQTTFGATFTAAKYQVRHKATSAEWPATTPFGWADITGSNRASSSHALTGLDTQQYDIELRFLPNSSLTSAAADVQAAPAPVPTQSGLSATTSLVTRRVDLTWDAQSAHQGSDVKFQVRSKPTSEMTWPTAWTDVPDSPAASGGDAGTHTHDETGYAVTGLDARRPYDFQLRLEIGDAGGPAVEVTNILAGYHPRGLRAATGTTPGSVVLSWDLQTANQAAQAQFSTRHKLKSAATFQLTGDGGWRSFLDQGDAGTDSHDETSYVWTELEAGVEYEFNVNFYDGTAWTPNQYLENVGARAAIVPTPTNFTAATATTTVNAIDLKWDEQTDSTNSDSKHQYRIKENGASWPSTSTMGWTDIGDGSDADGHTYDESGLTLDSLTAGTLYDVELRFFWTTAVGTSAAVATTATASAIPAPPNFSATSGSVTDTVDLSWDAMSGITKFQYRYKLDSVNPYATSGAGSWMDVPDSSDTNAHLYDETSYTVTGLTGGEDYDFELRAHTAANTFGPVATAAAKAQPQSPPTGLTAATGTNPGEIVLGWTAPAGSTHTGFQYRHKRTTQDDSAYSTWDNVPDSGTDGRANETAYTVASLWAGVGYTLQIRAQSASNNSEPGASTTATATAQVVAAPTGFSATRGSDPGEIDLTWTVLATTGLPSTPGTPAVRDAVVRYEYRYKLNTATSYPTTGAGAWAQVPDQDDPADGQADETGYTISGLTAYTAYDVQLRAAIHDNDEGTATTPEYHSASASDTNTLSGLAVPDDPQTTGGTNPGEISITWVAQTTFGSAFTDAKYQIRSKLASGSWPAASPYGWADISGSNRNTFSHLLTGLMNRQLHDIELRFVPSAAIGESAAAEFQGTPTAVPVPTGFTASTATATAGAISLTWMAQVDGTSSEAKYQYRRKLTSTGNANTGWPAAAPYGWTDIGDGSDADSNAYNENSLTFTGLNAGASYHVQLRFHWSDAVGASAASATQTARASNVPIPGTFAASSGSTPGSINLTWAAVTDASYQFRYKLASATNYPAAGATGDWASAGSGTSYTIMGLTNAASYDVQLRAVVSGSSSQPTPTRRAQAQSQPGPRNFAAAQGTNAGELALSWLAPMQGTPTRYDYRYKRATQAGTAYSNWASAGTGTSFTVTSLWAGVSYNVQLIAVTAVGNSLPVTATQTAQELAAPASFAGTIGDNPGEIDITWNAITSGLPTGDAVVQYQYRTKLPSASWPTTAPLGWVNIPAANTASYTITGLTSGTQYDVQLRAAVADGTEGTATTAEYHSDPATAAASIYSGLARPANLRATASTTVPGSIVLQWNQQSAFTAGTAKYQYRTRIASPPGDWTAWTDVPSSTHSTTGHTLTDLMNGERYNIEVRFYHSSTLGSSAATTVTGRASSIAVPTGFTAATSTTTAGAIDLRWNAQSAVTVSTALFQVRTRQRTTPPGAWSMWDPVPDDTSADDPDTDQHDETRHTLTGLTADQQYDIELRLFMSTDIGASDAATASATASSVPVPTGLDATTGSGAGEIDVTWTAVVGATSYQYRYKLESVGSYPQTGTGSWATTTAATSQTIQNLSGGEWYNVQVRALVTGIGESQPTTAVRAQAQTTPGPATLTFGHGPNPGDIKIDWTAPAMNAPVEHYEYRYKLETASTYPSTGTGSWAEVLDGNDLGTSQDDETTVTISGLQAGVSYHVQFRVYASSQIGYSLPQRGTQTARQVPPPTSFNAIGGGDPGEVDLSWTAPTGVTILRYELRHRLGTTGAWSSWTSAGTATTYTYTGLLAGMSRTFELRAVMQTVGASAPVSTTGTPTPVPTPASFSATTGVFPGEVDISWMAVNGATSYEYRYRLSSLSADPWPATEGWTSVAATMTSTTITLLDEGAAYTVEVRAAITNVGRSNAASQSASARGATFMDQRPNVPAIHAAYAVDAAAIPGRIAIELPGGTDPFIYRHRTVNPGQWSRWFKVTPQAGATQYLIPDLIPGVEYEIQVRAYTGMTTGFTLPLTAEAQAAPLVKAEDFEASESSGVILLQWSSPALYTPDYYEYRTKPTGTQTWSEWIRVDHEGDRGSTQRKWVTGLESGISHDFELRMQTGAGPSPVASSAGSARLRIAEVHSIRPTVREVSVRVGDTIALTVDIYDGQEVLDNSIPGKPGSKLVFRWEDKLADGSTGSAGGTFATPNNERRVTYTAPSSPGRYIVTAEAQPDGVCTSHHEGAAEITDAERAQCTATFTIRVSGIPAVPAPRPDPVDPTGAIPTSMTDDQGGTYTVFTPTKGGTFTGDDITVTAPAGAIPDRTVVGIGATTSDIPTPDPVPGATMSLAGSYYDINAIADTGEPPIPSYTLNEPATACLPFPQEFRADLTNVVVVQRKSAGDLSILSTKIRTQSGDLTVCGTLTQLPATVAVARLGLVPAPAPTTPATPADTPDTGATAPSTVALLLMLLTGLVVLTGISRIRRMIRE